MTVKHLRQNELKITMIFLLKIKKEVYIKDNT